MTYLIASGLSVILFTSFLALTGYESGRHMRVFSSLRSRLDNVAARFFAYASAADLPALLWHSAKAACMRLVHDFVALVLFGVRALERLLARAVAYLRSRRPRLSGLASRGSAFVENIAHFKHTLRHKRAAGEDETTPG